MFLASDLPEIIPVFPLPGAILLPRARLPLHIFEPRFLVMLDDVLKSTDRLVGMVQPVAGSDKLHAVGCAGRVVSFSETDDRRYMITLLGVSRFNTVHDVQGFASYRKCKVNWQSFETDFGKPETATSLDREFFFSILARYFELKELKWDWESLRQAEDELLINSVSMMCPFSPEEKQALIEADDLNARSEILVMLLEIANRAGVEKEVMQ